MANARQTSQKPPNFLFILADDLGFSDIGCYGSEIKTPNIDQLASEGLRLLQHHTAAACSPTRAMLMTGTDAHLGGLGTLIEFKMNEQGRKRYHGKAGYEGFLNSDVAALPEILSDNGYFTVMSGKWHLGLRASQGPWARGFQKAVAMLPGCSNHYGWEPVQERFPVGGRSIHAEAGVKLDIPPNKTGDPNDFYSTDYYTDRMIKYLDSRSGADKSKPFFAYLPYTAPHWPLQCAKEKRDKYKGMYNDGPHELRARRLDSLRKLKIIDDSVIPHELVTTLYGERGGEWADLSASEKLLSSRTMETYAGMVETIDDNVGKIVEYLKRTHEYDNTFIVFMSDNGAEGAALEANPVMGDNIKRAIHQYYDNSYDNIGAYNSYTWLGPLWAQASTAPSRLFKLYPSEGGILVPCVVKPPRNTFLDSFAPGSLNRSFTTVMDFAPTFLDLAGVSLQSAGTKDMGLPLGNSTTPRKMSQFRGRQVYAMRGKSWLPFFGRGEKAEEDETWAIYASTEPVGWELYSRAALRKGAWKIVHIEKNQGGAGVGDAGWDLFNVAEDPGETKNLAEAEPAKLEELIENWNEYVVECGVVWGESASADGISKEEAPHLWEDDTDLQRAWMGAKGGEAPV